MIQVCLDGESEDEDLVLIIKRLAQANRMNIHDRSKQSNRELTNLGQHPGYRIVNISASRPDGLGVAVGNLGLSEKEFAIGITQGSDREETDRLTRALEDAIPTNWNPQNVPAGQGAKSSSTCTANE